MAGDRPMLQQRQNKPEGNFGKRGSSGFGWLEEGVPYDTNRYSNSVKKLEKYCHAPWKARTIFGWLEEGVPSLEYARGAGKNRGENRGWGTPSFITGQPGILVEMTGVKQATNLHEAGDSLDVCHIMPFMWARPVTRQQMKGYPQLLLSLPRIFCEGKYKGKRFNLEVQ